MITLLNILQESLSGTSEKSNPMVLYMQTLKPHLGLLNDYVKLRTYFKDSGFSEKDIESISSAPEWVWKIQREFSGKINKIKQYLIKLGVINDLHTEDLFMKYIVGELKRIDLEFPLNPTTNPNTERDNN